MGSVPGGKLGGAVSGKCGGGVPAAGGGRLPFPGGVLAGAWRCRLSGVEDCGELAGDEQFAKVVAGQMK